MKFSVWINNAPRDRAGHVYPQGLAREKGGKPFVFDSIEEANAWLDANGYANTTNASVRRSGYACEALNPAGPRPLVPRRM